MDKESICRGFALKIPAFKPQHNIMMREAHNEVDSNHSQTSDSKQNKGTFIHI
jgi:hypothetical protein